MRSSLLLGRLGFCILVLGMRGALALTITHNNTVILREDFQASGQELAPADADPRDKMWRIVEVFPYNVQVVETNLPPQAPSKRCLRLHTLFFPDLPESKTKITTNVSRTVAQVIFKKPIGTGKLVWEFSAYLHPDRLHNGAFVAWPSNTYVGAYSAVAAVYPLGRKKGHVSYLVHGFDKGAPWQYVSLDRAANGGVVRFEAGRWQKWRIEYDQPERAAPRYRVTVDSDESDWIPFYNAGPIGALGFILYAAEQQIWIAGTSR